MGQERYPDICYKKTIIPMQEKQYYCPSGYILKGTKCTKTLKEEPKKEYTCPYYLLATYDTRYGLCTYTPLNKRCATGEFVVESYSNGAAKCGYKPTILYTCPDGKASLYNITCNTEIEKEASYETRCLDGYNQENNLCTKIEYEVPSYSIGCENGFQLINKICVKTIAYNANEYLNCPSEYNLVDGRCIKYEVMEPLKYYE